MQKGIGTETEQEKIALLFNPRISLKNKFTFFIFRA
jgi:hypothetical protein